MKTVSSMVDAFSNNQKIKIRFKENGRILRKIKVFEILVPNQDNLLEHIYKLLFKYDMEKKQIKNCMVKQMQNFKDAITIHRGED